MPTELTISNVTATSASVAIAGIPAGGSVLLMISDNPRFDGLVSWRTLTATPFALSGLNQTGTYYLRARGITAGGVYEAWGKTVGLYTPLAIARDTAPAAVLVTPAIIVPPEPIIAITSVTAVAGYPASNMVNDDPSLMFVSLGSSNFTIETAGAPIDTIAVLDTNFAEDITWQVAGGATAAQAEGGAPAYLSPVQQFGASAQLTQRRGYHGLMRLSALQSHRFWNVRVVAGSVAGGMSAIRYCVIGRARTAKNIAADKLESPLDLGSIDRGRDGTADRVFGHRMRKVDFEISMLTEMQWETQFADLWQKIGLNEPVLVVPNAKTGAFLHDRILYGTLAAQRSTNVVAPRFTQGFSVESLI